MTQFPDNKTEKKKAVKDILLDLASYLLTVFILFMLSYGFLEKNIQYECNVFILEEVYDCKMLDGTKAYTCPSKNKDLLMPYGNDLEYSQTFDEWNFSNIENDK